MTHLIEHTPAWSYKTLKKAAEEKTEQATKEATANDNKVEADEEKLKSVMLELFKLFRVFPLDDESKKLAEQLKGMDKAVNANRLIGYIESIYILPKFKEGHKTHARRAVHYYYDYSPRLLLKIEELIGGGRVDMIIKNTEGEAKDKEGQIYVEVKNWTGFEKLQPIERRARLASLIAQLEKYKGNGNKVMLEWKGTVPEDVQARCKIMRVDIISI